ncbi:MAG TPA: type II secretion system protein GspD [Aeromonadales bacterium]|nr:type II secretion system protein GspD [Aeromonadales bacterium]
MNTKNSNGILYRLLSQGKSILLGLSLIVILQLNVSSVYAASATLNMKDAELRTLIETVSRLTGKTFVLDQRVNRNQKVTIISQHRMTEQEIYQTFLSVLKVHGLTAIETGPVTKIMQEQQAKQDSTPISTSEHNLADTDQLITQVIKLNNISVGEVQIMLRPLIRQQGQLGVYKQTNVIVITDYSANVKRMIKLIRQVDKESSQEIELIPLEHASASEIVRILEALNKNAGPKVSDSEKPKFVADERTNSILLSASKSSRVRLLNLIKKLDTPLGTNGNTQVIYLHYAKATDLVEILNGVGKSKEEEEKKKKSGSSRTARRSTNNTSFSIEAHEETNALVITAPPDVMRSFEDVIRHLDIRRAQVHVEAIIVEISENRAKQLGVQWIFGDQGNGTAPAGIINFSNIGPGIGAIGAAALANQRQDNGSTTSLDNNGNPVTVTNTTSGDNGVALAQVLGGLQGVGIGAARFAQSGLSFAAFVQALASDTDTNILSTPSLTTLDNEEASMIAGQEIPIITGSQLGNNNSNPFQSIERKEIGIKLKIKPQINEGNVIRMAIEQEVSSVAGATSADVITNTRKIQTNVLVADGSMIVLGGLIDEQIQVSSQKVPILGSLPLIGSLFSSKGTTKVKRNLMVFIRPTISRTEGDIVGLSRKKYNYMRALQLDQQAKGIPLMPSSATPELPEWDDNLSIPPSFEEVMKKKREALEEDDN